MKKIITILLFVGVSLNAQNIVTSTSWVSAFTEVAGAKNVYNFAPAEMSHPPEYVLKPGDILKIKKADFVVFAGYEAMVKELKGPLELSDDKLIQINTSYLYNVISNSVLKIAGKLNSVEMAKKNLADLFNLYEVSRVKLKSLTVKKYLVHFHQQSIAKELGLNIVGVYGPGPITPAQLLEFKNLGADYIIDNIHGPVGKSLQEILPKANYVTFVNFPGTNGTKSLKDVILLNVGKLVK